MLQNYRHKAYLLTSGFVIALAVALSTTGSAEARLGESIQGFKSKVTGAFTFKSQSKKEDRTYYMFVMNTDAQTKQRAPGFAAAMTCTVVDGKIVGQSIALRMGENYESGKSLVTLHCMDFAYESLGKPPPKSKQAAEQELGQFSSAIDQVIAGTPQRVSYPGYNSRITISKSPAGDILVAATPELHPQAKSK